MVAVAVGGEAAGEDEVWLAAGDDVEDSGGDDGADDLGDDVGGKFGGGEALADDESDGDGGVEVAAGDVADGEGHGQDGEAEGEGNTDEAIRCPVEVGESRRRGRRFRNRRRQARRSRRIQLMHVLTVALGRSSFPCDFVGQIFAEDETTALDGARGLRKCSTILLDRVWGIAIFQVF